MPTVTVFGGADPGPGASLYADAREAGRRLAVAGCRVATGGYGGIMEAVSRGARDAGGEVVGVTTAAFRDLEPNRWVGELVVEADLFARTRRLLEVADAFLVFPGRSGTLSEISFLWALVRSRHAQSRPVALVGEKWKRILRVFIEEDILEQRVRRDTVAHPDGPEAAAWLVARLGSAVSGGPDRNVEHNG